LILWILFSYSYWFWTIMTLCPSLSLWLWFFFNNVGCGVDLFLNAVICCSNLDWSGK
jgi:hypothetical protein